jgi:glycosyltransferase involved in cell wall biosynthesis
MHDNKDPEIQIVMPVHNEADCIRPILTEIHQELGSRVPHEFLICEDGSTDGTRDILRDMARELPLRLITGAARKGYTPAMIDGLKASSTDFVLCLDSDGQYLPEDFWRFYEHHADYDLSIGWRHPRRDVLLRRLLSKCFGLLHAVLFHVPLHDPSCGFLLIRRTVLGAVLHDMGRLKQGFQWELTARAHRHGFHMREIEVRHRTRRSGTTRVFHLQRLPGIAMSHAAGLFRIWWETRKNRVRLVPYPARES